MTQKFIKILTITSLVVYYFLPLSIKAEDLVNPVSLYLLPDKNFYNDPEYLVANVYTNSHGQAVNAVNVDLDFDKNKLTLINSEINNSLCEFTIANNLDNKNGNYNLLCGTPNPLKDEEIFIAQLMFKKIDTGWAQFAVDGESMILIDDGLGTNILENTETHMIYLPTQEEINQL
jgi:hypothetical protein